MWVVMPKLIPVGFAGCQYSVVIGIFAIAETIQNDYDVAMSDGGNRGQWNFLFGRTIGDGIDSPVGVGEDEEIRLSVLVRIERLLRRNGAVGFGNRGKGARQTATGDEKDTQ